jgi:hypothetical protein
MDQSEKLDELLEAFDNWLKNKKEYEQAKAE